MILSENHAITEPRWVIIDPLGNDKALVQLYEATYKSIPFLFLYILVGECSYDLYTVMSRNGKVVLYVAGELIDEEIYWITEYEDYEQALDIYGSLSSYLKNYTELKKKVINGNLLPRCAEPT